MTSPSESASARRGFVAFLGRVPISLWAILGVATLVRIAGVAYGLPQELDPDEKIFADAVMRMVGDGTLDPGSYNHPAGTLIDVLALFSAAYGVVGMAVGAFDSLAAVREAYLDDVTPFFMMGRLIATAAGVGVVVAAYAIAREIRISGFWSLIAALLLALSPLLIQFSTIVRADEILSLALLLIVLVMLKALREPTARAFIAAGILLGLAVTSKYPGVLAVIPIVVANMTLTLERRVLPRTTLVWLGLAALASLVTAFIVSPFLFLNSRGMLDAIGAELSQTFLGATGPGFFGALWDYLTVAVAGAIGTLPTVLGVAGLTIFLLMRRERLVALTFWVFLVFISVLSLWWARWAVPLVPFVAVGAAFLAGRVETAMPERVSDMWMKALRWGVAALMVLPLVIPAASNAWQRVTNDDTRVHADDWMRANIPEGSTLLIDSYTPQLPSDRYDVRIIRNGNLIGWPEHSDKRRPDGYFGNMAQHWHERTADELVETIADEGVDYVVISGLWVDLYRQERDTYPGPLAIYEDLLDTYPTDRLFGIDTAAAGPEVIILRTRVDLDVQDGGS